MKDDELFPQRSDRPAPLPGGEISCSSAPETGSDGEHRHYSSGAESHHHSSGSTHHHHHSSDGEYHHHHHSSGSSQQSHHRRVYQDYGSVVLGSIEDMQRSAGLHSGQGGRYGDDPRDRRDDDRRGRYERSYDDRYGDRYDDRYRDRYDEAGGGYDRPRSSGRSAGYASSGTGHYSGGRSSGGYRGNSRRSSSEKKKIVVGGMFAVLLVVFVLVLYLLLDPGEPGKQTDSGKYTPESNVEETVQVEDNPNSPDQ